MTRSTKTTVAAVAAGVITLGVGVGVATFASADPTPSTSPSNPASPSTPTSSSNPASPSKGSTATPEAQRGGPGGRGGDHGGRGPGDAAQAEKLATELGVTEAEVTEALKALREENKPTAKPSAGTEKPDPDAREAALVKGLAAKLGVDEAKVQSAFDKIQAGRQTERAAALKTKLDAAVTDGTLTQAEADAVTKAVEKGVISGGGR